MPTAYTILFVIILVVAVLTWVIPAGRYDYQANGEPVAGSYHQVEQNGQTPGEVALAPLEGLYEAIDIAAFILMVGGFLGVIAKTGAIDAGISSIITKLNGREKLLIPILMCAFALGGTTFGMAEETIAFYPLVLPIVVAAGYDTITAVSIIMLGAGVGVLGSTVNPFATGIAAGFAGVSLGEGMLLRVVMLLALLAAAIWYVMAYAARVKADPGRSLVADRRADYTAHFAGLRDQPSAMTGTQTLALSLFGLTFLVMVYAVIPFGDMGLPLPALGWWFPELSALFLVAAILVGLLCRLKEQEIVESFLSGASELLGVAFIIGISRGITVIMNAGMITDTILSLRAGHPFHAHHGPAGRLCRRGKGAGHHGLPVGLRPHQFDYPHLGGGHGRPGHRPGTLRPLVAVCMEISAAGTGAVRALSGRRRPAGRRLNGDRPRPLSGRGRSVSLTAWCRCPRSGTDP